MREGSFIRLRITFRLTLMDFHFGETTHNSYTLMWKNNVSKNCASGYFKSSQIKRITLSTTNDEMSNPRVARKPPTKAVCLMPYLSARIPAKAKILFFKKWTFLAKKCHRWRTPDNKNVAPTVIDPMEEAFVEAPMSTSWNLSCGKGNNQPLESGI